MGNGAGLKARGKRQKVNTEELQQVIRLWSLCLLFTFYFFLGRVAGRLRG